MWDFFSQILTVFLAGGPGAMMIMLVAFILVGGIIFWKVWHENQKLLKEIRDKINSLGDNKDEYKDILALLNRYHEDRQAFAQAIHELKEALAKIMGKIF